MDPQDHRDLASAELIDLSQPLSAEMARWPGTDPIETTVLARIEDDGLYERRIELPEHVGTHVDAPAHFDPAGRTIDQLPIELALAPGLLIDAAETCDGDPGFALDAEGLLKLAAAQGVELTPGHVVLVRFGWDRYLGDQLRYAGDPSAEPSFPGLAPDAGRLLVERGIAAVGVDTLGVEPGAATDYSLHRITLGAGLFHLEGLVRLDRLPAVGFHVITAPLPLLGGSGAPTRVLALVPR